MNFSKFAFIFILTLGSQGVLSAQDWVSFQSQQQINDLVDIDNQLLLATDAGLVVMDKSSLEKTIYNKANSNLNHNHIQSITQDAEGTPFIGTYDVVIARFDGMDFQDIIVPEGIDYNPLTTVLYDFEIASNGDFWLATSSGVFHKQEDTWSLYDQTQLGDSFFEAWDIEINEAGEIFVASTDIHKYADGQWSNISENTEMFSYLDAELFIAQSGELYYQGDLEKIGRFDGQSWEIYDIEDFGFEQSGPGHEVLGFAEDQDGNIYFNTLQNGIYKKEGNNWVPTLNQQTEQFNNRTNYFYIDEQNNHWLNNSIYLSVDKNGVLESTSISQHTIEYDNIKKIHRGYDEKLFFISAANNSISVVDTEGNWSQFSPPSTTTFFESFEDMLFLSEDDIWVASSNGLYHYDGEDWTYQQLGACRSFALDSQGKIYVRATDKIYIIEEGIIIGSYDENNAPLSNLIINGHGVDANDNLWISSFSWEEEAAIHKVETNGSWISYTNTEHPVIDRAVGDFHFDNEGNVWIPSDFVGALKFDGANWTNPLKENTSELDNAYVYSIDSDASGKLYFAHQYGASTLLDNEWGNLLIEDVPNNFSSHTSDLKIDKDGTLWWASNRYGVFSYSPLNPTNTDTELNKNTELLVFPNPTKNQMILEFEIFENAGIKAVIYNNIGQEVTQLNFGKMSSGVFQQALNISSFPAGIYTIQLQVDDKSLIKKVIKN